MSMPTHMITCSWCTGCCRAKILTIDEDGLAHMVESWTCSRKRIILDDIDSRHFCTKFEQGRYARNLRKYTVTFVVSHTVTVEAEDEDEAEDAAFGLVDFGDFDKYDRRTEVEEVTA